MKVEIREFLPSDYDAVLALWSATEGIVLRDVDKREAIERYLATNQRFSFVAVKDGQIIGAVLSGTDGRRGYLQHLAVDKRHRGQGIGRSLAHCSVMAIHTAGIEKCHLMVLNEKAAAREFWRHLGWVERSDVQLMSYTHSGVPTA